MKIEILFAVDQEDNTKINLLAAPYYESLGEEFIKDALLNKLGLDKSDWLDELCGRLATGAEESFAYYDFGWETIELIQL